MSDESVPDSDQTKASASIGKKTLAYLPGRFIPAGVAFLTTAILTNRAKPILSAADFCRYDLTMRVVMFLSMISVIWLGTALLRFYPRFASETEGANGEGLKVFNSVFALLRWGCIGGGLLILALIAVFGPESLVGSYRDLFGIAAFVFIGNGLMELGLAMARAKGTAWSYSAAAVLSSLLGLPLGILLLRSTGYGVGAFFAGVAFVTISVAIILSRNELKCSIPLRFSSRQKALLKECLAYGIPLMATSAANFALGNSDRFLLKYMLGDDSAVGAYAATCRLLEQPVTMVFQTLMVAVFPAIIALYETKGRDAAEDLMRDLTRQFFLFCAPAAVMLSVLSHHVMFTLTEAQYHAAYITAPWLVAASFTYGLSYYASFGLHLSKRTGLLLSITILSIMVNFGVNAITIHRYGYVGCGVARLTANATLTILLAFASRRYLRWTFPWKNIARIGAASLAAGLVAYFIQSQVSANFMTLVMLGSAFAVVYAFVCLISGEVSVREIMELLPKFRRC